MSQQLIIMVSTGKSLLICIYERHHDQFHDNPLPREAWMPSSLGSITSRCCVRKDTTINHVAGIEILPEYFPFIPQYSLASTESRYNSMLPST